MDETIDITLRAHLHVVNATTNVRATAETARAEQFEGWLKAFMARPSDKGIERAFAAALARMQFYVPVQMAAKQTANGLAALTPNMTRVTYMADNQRYLPVFVTAAAAKQFAREQSALSLQVVAMPTGQAMSQAEHAACHGVLIDVQSHCAPVSLEYWHYIQHVEPVVVDDLSVVKITPVDIENTLTVALRPLAKKDPQIRQLWVARVQLAPGRPAELTVIADYDGEDAMFDSTVAPVLAAACKRVTGDTEDVLTGTLSDPLSQQVQATLTPVYHVHNARQQEA